MRSPLLLLALAACHRHEEPEPTFTYYEDVGPLLRADCVGCHRDGDIGPMPLDSYDRVRQWGPEIVDRTKDRSMPPFLVTGDGTCGDFADTRWLDDEEIDMLQTWVQEGMPAGEVRQLEEPEILPHLDQGIDIGFGEFTPIAWGDDFAKHDEYRCFRVDPGLDADTMLTAYDVRPGNPAIVHHVLAMPVDPQGLAWDGESTNGEVMDSYDGADGRPGWPCFGAAGDNIGFRGIPVTWAPGQGTVDFPSGTGVPLGANDEIVIQVHYNLAEVQDETDATTVRLEVSQDASLRPAFMALPDALLDTLFQEEPHVLAGGQESEIFSFEVSAEDLAMNYAGIDLNEVGQVDLYGVMPHMHGTGHKENLTVIRGDGSEECQMQVEDWDFAWQRFYFYREPVALTPGDSVRITCDYDTRLYPDGVLPGWGSQNEMCLTVLYLAL